MAGSRTAKHAQKRKTPSRRRPIAIDLFSGAGGFSLGAEQAGFDVVAAVEYDPIHAAAHKYNFPECEMICADAATLSEETLREAIKAGVRKHRKGTWNGELDLIVGGVPCQGFSAIGKRHPDDPRNLLAFSFLNIVKTLKPRYFLMENVQGMTSFVDPEGDGEERLLTRLIADFEKAGYSVLKPSILNASAFGVPQDRKRLILIGSRNGQTVARYPSPSCLPATKRAGDTPRLGEAGHEKSPVELSKGPTVSDALADLPIIDEHESLIASDTLTLSGTERQELEAAASTYVRTLRGLRDDKKDFSYKRKWDRKRVTGLMRTTHEDKSVERFEKTQVGSTEPISRYYRLDPEGLCSTLRAGTGYERGSFMAVRPIHPTEPRVIAVREAARLHSFPDWFSFHITKWHGFRQIGNSLPPLLGRAVASEIVAALGISPVKPKRVVELGDETLRELATYAAADHFKADLETVPTHARRHRKRKKTSAVIDVGASVPDVLAA
jgi:DNA (cytosine-5)-methyltransferase 1